MVVEFIHVGGCRVSVEWYHATRLKGHMECSCAGDLENCKALKGLAPAGVIGNQASAGSVMERKKESVGSARPHTHSMTPVGASAV